jgi:hypothetical protein
MRNVSGREECHSNGEYFSHLSDEREKSFTFPHAFCLGTKKKEALKAR